MNKKQRRKLKRKTRGNSKSRSKASDTGPSSRKFFKEFQRKMHLQATTIHEDGGLPSMDVPENSYIDANFGLLPMEVQDKLHLLKDEQKPVQIGD